MYIPKFAPKKPAHARAIPDRLIAAVRYDFEVGMLSLAQLRERYGTLMHPSSIREITAGELRPEIKASKFVLNWR